MDQNPCILGYRMSQATSSGHIQYLKHTYQNKTSYKWLNTRRMFVRLKEMFQHLEYFSLNPIYGSATVDVICEVIYTIMFVLCALVFWVNLFTNVHKCTIANVTFRCIKRCWSKEFGTIKRDEVVKCFVYKKNTNFPMDVCS